MDIIIENQYLRIAAETHGAQLRYILGSNRIDYLWRGDNIFWQDRAPILFPYVARLTNGQYTYNGATYSMPIHGFSAQSEFQPEQISPTQMRFHLFHSPETMEMYPFPFHFIVDYQLANNTLIQTYNITNIGTNTLYFGIGTHHGFNVPLTSSLNFEDYVLVFEPGVAPTRLGFSEDCFPNGIDTAFPLENKTLPLYHKLFDNDAIVLKNAGNCVRLTSKKDTHTISIAFPNAPYLALWHTPRTNAPYLCIEAWYSLPSRKDIIEALETQPTLIQLAPGANYTATTEFTFT